MFPIDAAQADRAVIIEMFSSVNNTKTDTVKMNIYRMKKLMTLDDISSLTTLLSILMGNTALG